MVAATTRAPRPAPRSQPARVVGRRPLADKPSTACTARRVLLAAGALAYPPPVRRRMPALGRRKGTRLTDGCIRGRTARRAPRRARLRPCSSLLPAPRPSPPGAARRARPPRRGPRRRARRRPAPAARVAAPFAMAVGAADPFLDRQPYLELAGLTIQRRVDELRDARAQGAAVHDRRRRPRRARPRCPLSWAMRALRAPGAGDPGRPARSLPRVLGAEANRAAPRPRPPLLRRPPRPRPAASPPRSRLPPPPLAGPAERIHDAMAARGFDGELRLLSRPAWRATGHGRAARRARRLAAASRFLPLVDWLGRWTRG